MSKLIMPIGISGCGKTTFGNKLYKKYNIEIICPDDIRKRFSSSLSFMHDDQAFEVCSALLKEHLERNKDVFYSATFLKSNARASVYNIASTFSSEIIIIIFCLSFRPDICRSNVMKDIKNGTDRPNTLIKFEDGTDAIDRQYRKFISIAKNLSQIRNEISKYNLRYKIAFIQGLNEKS